jgi:rhamnosyltransferase
MASSLAVVVTYHPEANIIQNVEKLLKEVSRVVIVDNNSSAETKLFFKNLPAETVNILYNETNRGVAEAFNQGMQWGLKNHFEYFLLMDQDSCPEPGMFEKLFQVCSNYEKNGQWVLVGPRHEDFNRKLLAPITSEISPEPLLITSGSLVSKKLIEKVGFYDNRLFIDHVDHDYSLRIAKSGGQCLRVNSAILLHRFGKAEVKRFLGKAFFLQDYSAFRRYHMMRNRIVLYKRYGMFKGEWFWRDLRSAVVDFIKLVLFETGKIPKLKSVFRGLWDGLCWQD